MPDEVEKEGILIYFGILDLKSGDQAPSVDTKVDLEDETSSGTNNKWK